jgi:hypothetical protein
MVTNDIGNSNFLLAAVARTVVFFDTLMIRCQECAFSLLHRALNHKKYLTKSIRQTGQIVSVLDCRTARRKCILMTGD